MPVLDARVRDRIGMIDGDCPNCTLLLCGRQMMKSGSLEWYAVDILKRRREGGRGAEGERKWRSKEKGSMETKEGKE